MSKNVKVNGIDYNGVSTVTLPTASGGTATFKDVDEVVTPSGTKTITANGTHDVTNFASVLVNIATSGGSSGGSGNSNIATGEHTIEADCNSITIRDQVITHGLGVIPDIIFFINKDPSEALANASANGVQSTLAGYWVNHGIETTVSGTKSKANMSTIYTNNATCAANIGASSSDKEPYVSANSFELWQLNATYAIRKGTYKWYAIKLS